MKLLGAVRLSKDSDASTSPERQRQVMKAFAKLNGHTIARITEDLDVSGAVAPQERPELGPALAKLSTYDAVIIAKLDRISRSLGDFISFYKWLDSQGKTLICIEPALDFSTPSGRFIAHVLMAFAEMEREIISGRTRDGFRSLRLASRWGGGQVPFGLTTVPREGGGWQFAHDPVYAPYITTMADKVLSGVSMNQVAIWLQSEGVLTSRNVVRQRNGKELDHTSRWTVQAVRGVLTGPAATGQMMRDGLPMRDADGELLMLDCPPILPPTVQLKVARAITGPEHRTHRVDANPLLQVGFCGCAAPLYTTSPGSADRPRASYFRCRDHKDCHSRSIPSGILEEATAELFLEICGHLEILERINEPAHNFAAELELIESRITELDAEYEHGSELSAAAYARMSGRLEAARAKVVTLAAAVPSEPQWTGTGVTVAQSWSAPQNSAQGRRKLMQDSGFRVMANRGADGAIFVLSLAGPELANRVESALKGDAAKVAFPATSQDLGMPLQARLYTTGKKAA